MSLHSGNRSKHVIYVYDLPYTERKCLCNILDINDQWERLGGEKMGFSVIELSEIKRAEKCGESPSDRLLQLWGRKNNTIVNLYLLLYDIEHYQAMNVLQPFIPEEYHLDKIRDNFASVKQESPKAYRKPPAKLLMGKGSDEREVQPSKRLNNKSSDNYQETAQDTNLNQVSLGVEVAVTEPTDRKIPDHFLCVETKQQKDVAYKREETSTLPTVNCKKHNPTSSEKILNTQTAAIFPEYEKMNSVCFMQKLNEKSVKGNNMTSMSHNVSTDYANKLIPPLETVIKTPEGSQRRHHSTISSISNLSECGVPMIPYKELEDATTNWSKQHLLGSGGFGSVYKGTWINVEVAIKRINASTQSDPTHSKSQNITQTLDELKYLLRFRHDNILQVYGFSADEGKPLCLVYQFMPNGSLEYRLQCKKIEGFGDKVPKPLIWYERFFIAKGTAAALEFLHTVQDKPLIHGDVKSANILLDKNLEPKLGDFGLAREGPQSHYTSMQVSHVHGTRPYIPEEYLRSKKLSTKVDTYSYGIVLFEICSGLRAYNEKNRKYLKDQVLDTKDHLSLKDTKGGPDSVNVFEILFEIGLECINKVPKKRPDMTATFQKLKFFAKALTKDDSKNTVEDSYLGSSSVSPLPFQAWQDTIATHSTSPSTFQSAAPFLHPSRVPTSHIHQLNQMSVPASHPYASLHGFSPLSNPSRSHIPHMISGIPIPPPHGWMKGISVSPSSQNTGGNIYAYPQNIHVPAGVGTDHLHIRNTAFELTEASAESEPMLPEGQTLLPDLSRLMLHSSNNNIGSEQELSSLNSSSDDSSDSDAEKSSIFSLKSHRQVKGIDVSDDLLKSYATKVSENELPCNKNASARASLKYNEPSSVGKKSLLD